MNFTTWVTFGAALGLLGGVALAGAELKIEGGGVTQKGKSLILRVEARSAVTVVRWYQIIPDISHYYKNANHPWEEEPYKWVGFGKIDYERREIESARGKWELPLFDPEDRRSPPLRPTRRAAHFRRDVGVSGLRWRSMKEGKLCGRRELRMWGRAGSRRRCVG